MIFKFCKNCRGGYRAGRPGVTKTYICNRSLAKCRMFQYKIAHYLVLHIIMLTFVVEKVDTRIKVFANQHKNLCKPMVKHIRQIRT